MGVFEALVLFALGLLFGIVATVFDVLAVGSASFVSHASLWVLVNALFSAHVGSRKNALLWSIPFNLGYIECYYLTTAATYEGYAKSLVVPLAAMALVGPLLSYALWTARQDHGIYGRFLAALSVAGTLAASYLIDGAITVFDGVVCVLSLLVILVLPSRTYDVTKLSVAGIGRRRGKASDLIDASEKTEAVDESQPSREERPKATKRTSGHLGMPFVGLGQKRSTEGAEERHEASRESGADDESISASDGERLRPVRPTRRRGSKATAGNMTSPRATKASMRRQKQEREREAEERESRRREAREYRRQRRSVSNEDAVQTQHAGVSPLGTARSARPSTRSRRT